MQYHVLYFIFISILFNQIYIFLLCKRRRQKSHKTLILISFVWLICAKFYMYSYFIKNDIIF